MIYLKQIKEIVFKIIIKIFINIDKYNNILLRLKNKFYNFIVT